MAVPHGNCVLVRWLHQVSLALVLGNHQVDCFLGIVQVEFVVFRLIDILAIIFFALFLI